MPLKDKEEARRWKRLYMRRYRRTLKEVGIAKLSRIQKLVSEWDSELEKRKASSARVVLARKLLNQLKQILEGKKEVDK